MWEFSDTSGQFLLMDVYIFSLLRFALYIASNLSNTRDSLSSGYPNIEERVENTTLSLIFDIPCQSKQKLRSKRRSKIVKVKRKRRNREGGSERWPGYVMSTKVIFNLAKVSISGGSLFSETSPCSLASLSVSQ